MTDTAKCRPAPAIAAAIAFAATALVPGPIAAQGMERPETQLEESSARLAAVLSIGRLAGRLQAEPMDDEGLFDEMDGNPARYRVRDEAAASLRTNFSSQVAARFSSEAAKILRQLAGDRDVRDVFGDDFAAARTNPAPAFIDAMVDGKYMELFGSARARAVKSQAGRISAKTRPTVDEVDSLDERRLAEILEERIAREQPQGVFEENLQFIRSDIVRPMIEEAAAQRGWQRGVARSCQAEGHAPSVVASNIARRVREAIDARRRDSDSPDSIYGMFPSVAGRTIPDAASGRVAAALDRILDDTPVPLDSDAIALAIAQDIDSHRSLAESRKAFLPGLADRMKASAAAGAAGAAPDAERGELLDFAERHFSEKGVGDRLSKRVSHELDASLKELREAFAGVQFEKTFPELAKRTWAPSETLVERVAQSNDFRKALAKWRGLEGLEGFAAAAGSAPLLEECERLLDRAVVARFEPGVASLASQNAIVDSTYPDIRGEFAGKQPSLDEVVARFTAAAAGRWDAERASVLSEADAGAGLYKSLFPSVVGRIELMSRAIMEAQREQDAPEETPEETPPPPPEELEEIELDFSISFDRRHGEIVAETRLAGESVGRSSCPYPPSAYRKGADGFARGTADTVGGILRETVRTNRVRLMVAFEVLDDMIYYGAVRDVIRALRSQVEELGEYVPSFELKELPAQ